MANTNNYNSTAPENQAAVRAQNYTYFGAFQIWSQDNISGRNAPFSILAYGYNWNIFYGGNPTPGQGQIFPQGTYFYWSDMKVYVVEIDFGAVPTWSKTFTITDSNVQLINFVLPFQAGIAASGPRPVDESDMDKILLVAVVAAGSFTLYTEGVDGPLSGKYKIGYQIGVL